jgi:hypothetical protein
MRVGVSYLDNECPMEWAHYSSFLGKLRAHNICASPVLLFTMELAKPHGSNLGKKKKKPSKLKSRIRGSLLFLANWCKIAPKINLKKIILFQILKFFVKFDVTLKKSSSDLAMS